MPDPKMAECLKCGAQCSGAMTRRQGTTFCQLYKEPIPEMIELGKCDRGSGDYFPDESEQL